jgi:hypothetical protein
MYSSKTELLGRRIFAAVKAESQTVKKLYQLVGTIVATKNGGNSV